MSWTTLFERVASQATEVDDVTRAVTERRESRSETARDDPPVSEPADPSPARVVADADVLAADLLVGGPAREALDHVRAHSWVVLVASDDLLDDATAAVEAVADPDLAADWREHADTLRDPVAHPPGDHPALASASRGGAMHVLTFDEALRSASAGAAIRDHVETSVKHPRAFARLFDPAALYGAVVGGDYPGPDGEVATSERDDS